MLEASIIIIGDEILAGAVPDSNGHLAAERLRSHGVPLTGVHVVPDERPVIGGTLRTELERGRPRLVITTGGIGSTPDDVTFAAIAECLGLELRLSTAGTEQIDGAIADLEARGFEVDRDEAMSMAVVPEGAEVLIHSGWVCGIRLDVDGGIEDDDGATVVALPGIPTYFRTVLDEVIVPYVVEGHGADQEVRELRHDVPEMVLAPLLRRLAERWPEVRVGSYPGDPMLIRLFGSSGDVDEAAETLDGWLNDVDRARRG